MDIGFNCDPIKIEAFARILMMVAALPEKRIKTMSEAAFLRPRVNRQHAHPMARRIVAALCQPSRTVPFGRSFRYGCPSMSTRPLRIRLFNVKYSPNLGDGLLSEALENALREMGCDERKTYSVDLAGRNRLRAGKHVPRNVAASPQRAFAKTSKNGAQATDVNRHATSLAPPLRTSSRGRRCGRRRWWQSVLRY